MKSTPKKWITKAKEDLARTRWPIFGAALALALVLVCAPTLASYQERSEYAVLFSSAESGGAVYLLSPQAEEYGDETEAPLQWETRGEQEYTLRFLLANGTNQENYSGEDQRATIQLIGTVAIPPERVTITLQDGVVSYTAQGSPLAEGTSLYENYGEGWSYRFYNEAGEELTWPLMGGRFSSREFVLTVSSSEGIRDPAALTVQVTGDLGVLF